MNVHAAVRRQKVLSYIGKKTVLPVLRVPQFELSESLSVAATLLALFGHIHTLRAEND